MPLQGAFISTKTLGAAPPVQPRLPIHTITWPFKRFARIESASGRASGGGSARRHGGAGPAVCCLQPQRAVRIGLVSADGDGPLLDSAKVGTLLGSFIAGVTGDTILRTTPAKTSPQRAV
jgi:hypothetical protein